MEIAENMVYNLNFKDFFAKYQAKDLHNDGHCRRFLNKQPNWLKMMEAHRYIIFMASDGVVR